MIRVGFFFIEYFFGLKLTWNNRSEPENNFDFRLIIDFRVNFWIVRDYKYILQDFYVFFIKILLEIIKKY
jgi:hypothetical protein